MRSWRAAVRGASLRTRVMAAAALLVVLTSLVTAVLGTTLLRSYLLSRSDGQRNVCSKLGPQLAVGNLSAPFPFSSTEVPVAFRITRINSFGDRR